MDEGGYPSVYVVDCHASRPPLPPKLNTRPRHAGAAQTLLYLLVILALCGMVIEACFIYRLYQSESETSESLLKLIGDQVVTTPTTPSHPSDVSPSKPVAHLTDGQDAHHDKQIMAWSMIAEPLLYEMDYKDRHLVIQKEGYYYVYSKVNFFDTDHFHHSINVKTERYSGESIPLLQSRKYSKGSNKMQSNSFLGGVFHLFKDDAIFVKVSDTSKIVRYKSFENIFGAYMI
ncbi:Tumor necrosis factor ligand superfamily member 6 CD95 ligand [Channa argus]|uniref:Tumor necrosis factor ligand superfamily member 6 CD95 ligand n=1 Tax=Channa argus TaxID=215402 RepID=A0A6G1QC62_CHAAH|nr:Tumor necrosis factor ligand superfamily member 6 CD95 ligand [Channa argus]KAK2893730.1 hypothetical protein Q8A73_016214 [Channa argus]